MGDMPDPMNTENKTTGASFNPTECYVGGVNRKPFREAVSIGNSSPRVVLLDKVLSATDPIVLQQNREQLEIIDTEAKRQGLAAFVAGQAADALKSVPVGEEKRPGVISGVLLRAAQKAEDMAQEAKDRAVVEGRLKDEAADLTIGWVETEFVRMAAAAEEATRLGEPRKDVAASIKGLGGQIKVEVDLRWWVERVESVRDEVVNPDQGDQSQEKPAEPVGRENPQQQSGGNEWWKNAAIATFLVDEVGELVGGLKSVAVDYVKQRVAADSAERLARVEAVRNGLVHASIERRVETKTQDSVGPVGSDKQSEILERLTKVSEELGTAIKEERDARKSNRDELKKEIDSVVDGTRKGNDPRMEFVDRLISERNKDTNGYGGCISCGAPRSAGTTCTSCGIPSNAGPNFNRDMAELAQMLGIGANGMERGRKERLGDRITEGVVGSGEAEAVEGVNGSDGRLVGDRVEGRGGSLHTNTTLDFDARIEQMEAAVQGKHGTNPWLSEDLLKAWGIPIAAPRGVGANGFPPYIPINTAELMNRKFGIWGKLRDEEMRALEYALASGGWLKNKEGKFEQVGTDPILQLAGAHYRLKSTASLDEIWDGKVVEGNFLYSRAFDYLVTKDTVGEATETRKIMGPLLAIGFGKEQYQDDMTVGRKLEEKKRNWRVKWKMDESVRMEDGTAISSKEEYKEWAANKLKVKYDLVKNKRRGALQEFANLAKNLYPEVFYGVEDDLEPTAMKDGTADLNEVLATAMGVSKGAVDLGVAWTRLFSVRWGYYRGAQLAYYFPAGNEGLWNGGLMSNIKIEKGTETDQRTGKKSDVTITLANELDRLVLDKMNRGEEPDFEKFGTTLGEIAVSEHTKAWADWKELINGAVHGKIRLGLQGKIPEVHEVSGFHGATRRIRFVVENYFRLLPSWLGFDRKLMEYMIQDGIEKMKVRGDIPDVTPAAKQRINNVYEDKDGHIKVDTLVVDSLKNLFGISIGQRKK